MDKLIRLLNHVFPFSYLTLKEKQGLIQNSQFISFEKGEVICKADSTDDIDWLFLLLEGNVRVIINNNVIGKIESPSYFGERAALFNQARKAMVQAQNQVKCMIINSDILKKILTPILIFVNPFLLSFGTNIKFLVIMMHLFIY